MRRIALFLLITLVFVPSFRVFAQTSGQVAPETPSIPADIRALLEKDPNTLTDEEGQKVLSTLRLYSRSGSTEIPNTPGAVSCFDYYHFGSVQVDISPTLTATVPGATMGFTGQVKNANDYPIVAGSVYAKIFFKKTQDDALTQQNGYALIDQFVVAENLSLAAQGEKTVSFAWDVPSFAETGDYQVAFYFTSAKRYNLLGLSFTDDVTGNTADFSVLGNTDTALSFDKNAVTLNDQPHTFAAFPRHFTQDEPVKAQVKLTNPKNETLVVPVSWKLYAWDGLREEALRERHEEVVTLKPQETKTLSYVVPPINAAVSYLVVQAQDQDTQSLLDIRFVRDGIEETRINFPSIATYPLKAGEEATVFSCVHSTNQSLVKGNTLTMTLRDESDQIIHTYRYEGDITGEMMGLKDTFTPSKTLATFSLTAALERDGRILEAVTQQYSCQDIDPTLCPKTGGADTEDTFLSKGISLIVALTLVLLLGLLFHKLWKDKREGVSRVVSLVIGVIISGALFFSGAPLVEAKSVTWTSSALPSLASFWNYKADYDSSVTSPSGCTPYGCGWAFNLYQGALASVTYKARLVNHDTGVEIADGSSLSVGTRIRIEQMAAADTDISWFGSGFSLDSPYGHWVANAGPLLHGCSAGDYTGTTVHANLFNFPVDTYHLLNVNPATATFSSSSANLSCVGNVCTVKSPGATSLSMSFSSTYGKFYQRYDLRGFLAMDCMGNNVPLRNSGSLSYATAECTGPNCLGGGDYSLSIPAQSISFSLTAVSSNNAPDAPVITGPALTTSGLGNAFSLSASDPDGDTIRYAIDWDNNGSVDAYAPVLGYVSSGTSRVAKRTWSSAGVRTFRVRTQDSKGGVSGWTSHTITVAAAPTLTFYADPPTVLPYTGGTATLHWTTTGTSCWASGGWTGWQATVGTPSSARPVSATTTFTLECYDAFGVSSGPRSVTMTVPAPPAPTVSLLINGAHSNLSVSKASTYVISWSVADAASCHATSSDDFGGVIATTPPTGSFSVTADFASLPTLSCTGFGGLVTTDQLSVDVICPYNAGAYGACTCATETKSRHIIETSCVAWDEVIDCDSSEKNACRDFNWKETAP